MKQRLKQRLRLLYLHHQGLIIVGGTLSLMLLTPLLLFFGSRSLFPEIKVLQVGCSCGRVVDFMVVDDTFSRQFLHAWVVSPGDATHSHLYYDPEIEADYYGNRFTVWKWEWKHEKCTEREICRDIKNVESGPF